MKEHRALLHAVYTSASIACTKITETETTLTVNKRFLVVEHMESFMDPPRLHNMNPMT